VPLKEKRLLHVNAQQFAISQHDLLSITLQADRQ